MSEADTNEATPQEAKKGATTKRPRKWRRRFRRAGIALVGGVGLLALASCIHLDHPNPEYPATKAEVRAAIEEMEAKPVGVERPVIVLSGYRAPSPSATNMAARVRRVTGADEDRVLPISYVFGNDIPTLADRVAKKVADEYGSTVDPLTGERWTVEVDVVAVSMGGLVARTAWAEPTEVGRNLGVRLNINTLYTLATPHRGAKIARWIHVDDAAKQMIPGSDFLTALAAASPGGGGDDSYTIVPYATLRDSWVGAKNAAPEGQEPIWVPGRLILSHVLVTLEDRILADLGRRLRGETPLAEPSAPPRD